MKLRQTPTDEPEVNLTPLIDVVFIGGEQVVNNELETLKGAITRFLGDRKEMPVVIRADRTSPYEAVIRAMDATSQLGLEQMSLATNQPDNGGE